MAFYCLPLLPSKSKTDHCLPIDLSFTSLAEVHQAHSIGVELSGPGSDETMGLKVIKNHGGITLTLDEASASYVGISHCAAHANIVDLILPPGKIPRFIHVTSKRIEQNFSLVDAR